jgi:hypothetical protein
MPIVRSSCALLIPLTLCLGCESNPFSKGKEAESTSSAKSVQTPAPAKPAIRIDAGATKEWKDSAGNVWLADTGFKDGETVERDASMNIAGTSDSAIYRTERYSMTAFSHPVPNGTYTVKLHFAETSGAIGAVGERIFSVNVEGIQINDLDVWAKAGAKEKAYVHPVDVEVTDGKLDISFAAKTQNPEINGIEILPR